MGFCNFSFSIRKTKAVVIFAVSFMTCVAHATGPKRPVVVAEPVDSQAFPVRILELRNVSASSFHLPNGNAVDMNMNLRELVDSQINQSAKFRTYQRNTPLARHGVIDATITSLEMEIASIGLRIGYRPDGNGGTTDAGSGASGSTPSSGSGGSAGSGTQLTGQLTVKLGQIAMDFKIFDSDTGETYSAVTTDQVTAGLDLSFTVDFSNVSIGPAFQFRQALSGAIRTLVSHAMQRFVAAPRMNFLPWQAIVREVDGTRKLVLFDAGLRAGVSVGNLFSVYSSCETGSCLEHYVGDVKVKRVLDGSVTGSDPLGYSEAGFKDDPTSTKFNLVRPGDKVYIYYMRGF